MYVVLVCVYPCVNLSMLPYPYSFVYLCRDRVFIDTSKTQVISWCSQELTCQYAQLTPLTLSILRLIVP